MSRTLPTQPELCSRSSHPLSRLYKSHWHTHSRYCTGGRSRTSQGKVRLSFPSGLMLCRHNMHRLRTTDYHGEDLRGIEKPDQLSPRRHIQRVGPHSPTEWLRWYHQANRTRQQQSYKSLRYHQVLDQPCNSRQYSRCRWSSDTQSAPAQILP